MLQVPTPGPFPELTSLSTGDYLESWLSQVRGRVRGRTYRGYAGLLRRYAIPLLGQVPLKDLHPLHLQHLYGQLLEERGRLVPRSAVGIDGAEPAPGARAVTGVGRALRVAGAEPRQGRPSPQTAQGRVQGGGPRPGRADPGGYLRDPPGAPRGLRPVDWHAQGRDPRGVSAANRIYGNNDDDTRSETPGMGTLLVASE
jgi:hypothetical protein